MLPLSAIVDSDVVYGGVSVVVTVIGARWAKAVMLRRRNNNIKMKRCTAEQKVEY